MTTKQERVSEATLQDLIKFCREIPRPEGIKHNHLLALEELQAYRATLTKIRDLLEIHAEDCLADEGYCYPCKALKLLDSLETGGEG